MIQALVGSIIVSVATTSLLIAINVFDNSLQNSKNIQLSSYEKEILLRAGYSNQRELINLTKEMDNHIEELFRENMD